MELRFSIFLVPLLLGTTLCQLDDLQKQMSRQQEKQKYCGSYLTSALSTVCKGKYYNTMHKKSEYSRRSYRSLDATGYISNTPSGGIDYPFQDRASATSLLGGQSQLRRRKRYGRGVYNECCEKSCTHDELEGYCAESSGRRR